MAEVTGSIGDQPVELNNAATEATLRLLLQSSIAANKQSVDEIKKLASKAFNFDEKSLEKFKGGIEDTTKSSGLLSSAAAGAGKGLHAVGFAAGIVSGLFDGVGDGLSSLTGKLLDGTAKASDFAAVFSKMPLGIGLVASAFQKLLKFQEDAVVAYQQLTNSGVNFSGDLTQMRLAAQDTYMTLDQFTNLIKNNTDVLTRMGGSADFGARAFVRLSNELISSEAGQNLRAMGVTTEQMNQGLLTYISLSGGRNREEIKNTKDITAASAELMLQLDGLAQITGKSREEQLEKLKEAGQNAAVEAKLATMNEAQKSAYLRGLAEMEGKFGKAGREMIQSQLLGIPPATEAARNLTALAPKVALASQGMVDVALKGGKAAETFRYSAAATEAGVEAQRRLGSGLVAVASFAQDGVSQAIQGLTRSATQAQQQGRTLSAEELAMRAEIAEKQRALREAEIARALKAQQAIQDLGRTISNFMLPVLAKLAGTFQEQLINYLPVIRKTFESVAQILMDFAKNMLTEEGRAKIANDISYYFKTLFIDLKKSILPASMYSEERYRAEMKAAEEEKREYDLRAKAAQVRIEQTKEIEAYDREVIERQTKIDSLNAEMESIQDSIKSQREINAARKELGEKISEEEIDLLQKQLDEKQKLLEKISGAGEIPKPAAIKTAEEFSRQAQEAAAAKAAATANLPEKPSGFAGAVSGMKRFGSEEFRDYVKSFKDESLFNIWLRTATMPQRMAANLAYGAAGGVIGGFEPLPGELKLPDTTTRDLGRQDLRRSYYLSRRTIPSGLDSSVVGEGFRNNMSPAPDTEFRSYINSTLLKDLPKNISLIKGSLESTAPVLEDTGASSSTSENLQSEMQTLNNTVRELVRLSRETAENSRRNVDATRALSGNLYPTP